MSVGFLFIYNLNFVLNPWFFWLGGFFAYWFLVGLGFWGRQVFAGVG
jgi:hypothetical protein